VFLGQGLDLIAPLTAAALRHQDLFNGPTLVPQGLEDGVHTVNDPVFSVVSHKKSDRSDRAGKRRACRLLWAAAAPEAIGFFCQTSVQGYLNRIS